MKSSGKQIAESASREVAKAGTQQSSADRPQRRVLDVKLSVVKKVITPGAFDC